MSDTPTPTRAYLGPIHERLDWVADDPAAFGQLAVKALANVLDEHHHSWLDRWDNPTGDPDQAVSGWCATCRNVEVWCPTMLAVACGLGVTPAGEVA